MLIADRSFEIEQFVSVSIISHVNVLCLKLCVKYDVCLRVHISLLTAVTEGCRDFKLVRSGNNVARTDPTCVTQSPLIP